MRKIPVERIITSRKNGGKIEYSDELPFLKPDKKEEKVEITPQPITVSVQNDPEVLTGIISILSKTEQNYKYLLSVLQKISQPSQEKPKKSFECTVKRDNRGNISSIEINEK